MRLVTWNIRGCLGIDNRRSVERVADVIRECRTDIVCLQEVHKWLPQSKLQDQPRMLSEQLGMRAYFLPSYRIGVGGFGNAILTNLPIREHRQHPLPNHGERRWLLFLFERRAIITADIDTDIGMVRVMAAHFSLNRFDRMRSVERVRALIAESDSPVVVCGDLNARPESEEMRYLGNECGLVDSGPVSNGPTFRADRPNVRIDYVWHSPYLSAKEAAVVSTRASDHLPVLVELDESVLHVK